MIGVIIIRGDDSVYGEPDTLEYLEFETDLQADEYIKENQTERIYNTVCNCWHYDKHWVRCFKVRDRLNLVLHRNSLHEGKK